MNSMKEESNEQLLCLLTNPPPPFYITLAVPPPPPPHHVSSWFLLLFVYVPLFFIVYARLIGIGCLGLNSCLVSWFLDMVEGCRRRRRLQGIGRFQFSSWKHNDEIVKNRRIPGLSLSLSPVPSRFRQRFFYSFGSFCECLCMCLEKVYDFIMYQPTAYRKEVEHVCLLKAKQSLSEENYYQNLVQSRSVLNAASDGFTELLSSTKVGSFHR